MNTHVSEQHLATTTTAPTRWLSSLGGLGLFALASAAAALAGGLVNARPKNRVNSAGPTRLLAAG